MYIDFPGYTFIIYGYKQSFQMRAESVQAINEVEPLQVEHEERHGVSISPGQLSDDLVHDGRGVVLIRNLWCGHHGFN